jgi:hypothetical protein
MIHRVHFYLRAIPVWAPFSGTFFDADAGHTLSQLTVPKIFWSATVYSMETKSFFANADRVAISSPEKAQLKLNPDGAVDLCFGPKTPDGLASNWIPTGGDFFLWFRLYGPEKPVFDKTWTLPDVEIVKY